jgi:hypothetical protein
MSTEDGGHRSAAVDALAGRSYELAGDEYTRAAWRVLADPRPDVETFDAGDQGWVGDGLQYLAVAVVCYRLAGRAGVATRRGVEGVAVARDLERACKHPVQRACLAEFVGDFRVVADIDGATGAYEDAADAYRDAGPGVDSPHRWGTTPLFEAAAAPLTQVARSTADGEIAVTWEDLHGTDPDDPETFLAHRTSYKCRRFPSLVERVLADGYLAAPRGTTEYDNATYRCPECGSNDVNWVADNVLCLRCSTPTREG